MGRWEDGKSPLISSSSKLLAIFSRWVVARRVRWWLVFRAARTCISCTTFRGRFLADPKEAFRAPFVAGVRTWWSADFVNGFVFGRSLVAFGKRLARTHWRQSARADFVPPAQLDSLLRESQGLCSRIMSCTPCFYLCFHTCVLWCLCVLSHESVFCVCFSVCAVTCLLSCVRMFSSCLGNSCQNRFWTGSF